MSYVKSGVDVCDFFILFEGNFRGSHYDSQLPSSIKFLNSKSCSGFEHFISNTVLDRLQNGKVGIPIPPHFVMPLTVEPFKPRLCHAERFLNLCIRDLLLPLDYISNLPRCVAKNHFQSTVDDKTSYDQLLSPNSTTYFGLDLNGWYFVYNQSLLVGKQVQTLLYHRDGHYQLCPVVRHSL